MSKKENLWTKSVLLNVINQANLDYLSTADVICDYESLGLNVNKWYPWRRNEELKFET